MSDIDSGDTPKSTTSKIPIRLGSTVAAPKQSRIPTRFGCESPAKAKPKKTAENTSSLIKNSERAGSCTNRKITEPHRVTISESLPLAPLKGSEGDQLCDRKGQNAEIDSPVYEKNLSLDVLMEPRLLNNKVSGVQIARSELMMMISSLGKDSLQSVCTDKSCEEVGEINEVGEEAAEIKADNVWEPVSEYLLNKNKMRTAGAQTSEASNIDDMDCVESGKYSVYSYEKIDVTPCIPGKIKPCSEISTIKIRHPAPTPSLAKLAATAALRIGLPIIEGNDFNADFTNGAPENKAAEKGDLKRKDTYTVFTEENSKDVIVNDGGDGHQISAEIDRNEDISVENVESEKNVLCVNISRITPSAFRGISCSRQKPPAFEIYPRSLLLIPDIKNPGGYIATLNITNNGETSQAWKICVNRAAHTYLLIEPQFGILPGFSEINVEILSRVCKTDPIGGFGQKFVKDAVLEVRSIEVFNMANQRQLSKLWRMAEARFSEAISSVRITSINLLEPCNKQILDAIDDPEASFVKGVMEQKYNCEMLPQMMINRDIHLHEMELAILERRVRKVWRCVQHMDFYLDIGIFSAYILVVYWGVLPYGIAYIEQKDAQSNTIDQGGESTLSKFTRYFMNLIGFP